jgi:biotin synthase
MGEPVQDRIDVAFEIKKYGGSSMPFNVFVQFEGIGIHNTSLPVLEILKTQSIYRLIMPRKDIISSGGRVKNFNELHPLALIATNGLVMSSYLTGQDRNPAQDEQMIRDLGLAI